jgi:hypothetical protein
MNPELVVVGRNSLDGGVSIRTRVPDETLHDGGAIALVALDPPLEAAVCRQLKRRRRAQARDCHGSRAPAVRMRRLCHAAQVFRLHRSAAIREAQPSLFFCSLPALPRDALRQSTSAQHRRLASTPNRIEIRLSRAREARHRSDPALACRPRDALAYAGIGYARKGEISPLSPSQ